MTDPDQEPWHNPGCHTVLRGAAMIIAAVMFALGVAGVAFAAVASHPRPNGVDVQTPSQRYDFHCGNESHPIPHAWLFRDCRRFTIGG